MICSGRKYQQYEGNGVFPLPHEGIRSGYEELSAQTWGGGVYLQRTT